jgi:hypothetical protein
LDGPDSRPDSSQGRSVPARETPESSALSPEQRQPLRDSKEQCCLHGQFKCKETETLETWNVHSRRRGVWRQPVELPVRSPALSWWRTHWTVQKYAPSRLHSNRGRRETNTGLVFERSPSKTEPKNPPSVNRNYNKEKKCYQHINCLMHLSIYLSTYQPTF